MRCCSAGYAYTHILSVECSRAECISSSYMYMNMIDKLDSFLVTNLLFTSGATCDVLRWGLVGVMKCDCFAMYHALSGSDVLTELCNK